MLEREARDPEEVEPPDGVGHERAGEVGPGRALFDYPEEGDFYFVFDAGAVGFNEGSFGGGKGLVFFRAAVPGEPDDQPDEIEAGGGDERHSPTKVGGDEGHHEGCDESSEVGAAIEDSGGKGSFFAGEPVGGGFEGGGEVGGLAEPEAEADYLELKRGSGEGVEHGSNAPDDDGQGVAEAGAEVVDQAARDGHHQRVGDLEGGDDGPVVVLIPAEFLFEGGLEDAKNLAVQIVYGGGEEEQAAHGPADFLAENAGLVAGGVQSA